MNRNFARETATEALLVTIALLIALAVGSVLILIYGRSPAQVYALMLSRTWGNTYGLGQVLFRATPLVFTGLSVALAFRAGLFNIGAEGQLLVGSFATAVVGAAMGKAPGPLVILVALLAGAAAGGALGALPGWLKARFGAHEVINTIMLNFIAQAMVLWVGRVAFFEHETVHTKAVAPAAHLPGLGLADSSASWAFPLAVLVAAAVWWLIFRTRTGFELRALGKSTPAAESGGVSVAGRMVGVMALAGALAGLSGAGTVLGYKGYFEEGLGSGAGFMGIAVALLGQSTPVGVVLAALLFGTLAQGGLAANALVPKELVEVLQAVIILAVAASSVELRKVITQAREA